MRPWVTSQSEQWRIPRRAPTQYDTSPMIVPSASYIPISWSSTVVFSCVVHLAFHSWKPSICSVVHVAIPSILFVCVHNAGRSQMAAAWTRHLAGDRVDIFSGGSAPASSVNPSAVEVMREVGIDMSRAEPKAFDADTVRRADVVITMGCGDTCPIFPGKRYEDWALDDPAGLGLDAVRPIRDEIRRRVVELLNDLGIESK